MQNQFFSIQRKGFLLTALFLTLGFCVQAQQSENVPAQPAATIIYSSQLSQLSPQKQEYIKAHPQEFIIQADPVQVATPAKSTETFTTPDGQVMPGKAPAMLTEKPVTLRPIAPSTAQPSQVPPTGKMPTPTEAKKISITKADYNKMAVERQQFVQAHPEQFEIIE